MVVLVVVADRRIAAPVGRLVVAEGAAAGCQIPEAATEEEVVGQGPGDGALAACSAARIVVAGGAVAEPSWPRSRVPRARLRPAAASPRS